MAKKTNKIAYPQVWIGPLKNGMREVAIIENFGNGPAWWRLWVPSKEKDSYTNLMSRVKKRMRGDHSIDLDYNSWLCSQENPLHKLLNKEE